MTLNLFISLYPEKNKERQRELITCLTNNAKVFDQIFILTERDAEIDFIPQIKSKAAIYRLPINVRPTYKSFFDCVNKVSGQDDINTICNADIYFKEPPPDLATNKCYALSRWDITPNGQAVHLARKDSQDSLVFKSRIKIPQYASFFIGVPGCDNRICRELLVIGYDISNPSITIKSYHLHHGEKSYDTATAIRVQRPYHFLPPIELI